MRKNIKTVVLSIMLVFTMAFSVVSIPEGVAAETATESNMTVKVGGKTIKAGAKNRELFGGSVSFDGATLTLKNVSITEAKTGISIVGSADLTRDKKIKIVFEGTNTIFATSQYGIRVEYFRECAIENNGTVVIKANDSCIDCFGTDLYLSGTGRLSLSDARYGVVQTFTDPRSYSILFASGTIDFNVTEGGIRDSLSSYWTNNASYDYISSINFTGADVSINAGSTEARDASAFYFFAASKTASLHGVINIKGGSVECSSKAERYANLAIFNIQNSSAADAVINTADYKYPIIKTGSDKNSAQTVSGLTTEDLSKAYLSITPTEVKVKLNANGGYIGKKSVKTKSITLAKGYTYGKLDTPKRKGYKFNGWYTKKSGGTKITAKTVVSGDTTLYARWKKSK